MSGCCLCPRLCFSFPTAFRKNDAACFVSCLATNTYSNIFVFKPLLEEHGLSACFLDQECHVFLLEEMQCLPYSSEHIAVCLAQPMESLAEWEVKLLASANIYSQGPPRHW